VAILDFQTKACLNKEILAFLRTNKFLIMVCVIIGWSILSPLIIVGMGHLMYIMSDIYDEFGMDVTGLTGELTSLASIGVHSQLSEIATVGLIVYFLLISSFAGGEQKKRSIIIPQSSGLSSFSYILPKFIVYPLTIFVLSLLGTLAAGLVSGWAFDYNDLVLSRVFVAGLILGVNNMFFTCLHLTLGTGTGKPFVSSAICIGALLLLPNIFTIANMTPAFNPFTLVNAASSALQGGETTTDILVGIIVAFVLMALLFYIALFAQNSRKIDNSGNEILI
jgi:ABC-2 type transport system permease protein